MARPRYVVFGTGAVGGTIGGVLAGAGHEVVAVARGDHGERLAADGLTLHRPGGTEVIRFAAVAAAASAVDWRSDDVVIVAVKTQDSVTALDAIRGAGAPATVAIVCAQNGVENERLALRRFEDVHGMCVMLPATHLEPGVVVAHGAPAPGILDLGRFPSGSGATDDLIAADLEGAGFSSRPRSDIMRWKYAKLLLNLGNVIEAACGRAARRSGLYEEARAEARSCFAAAGIEPITDEEDRARREGVMRIEPVEGQQRGGGSSWQSLARNAGSIETDYLNGEIVLLGRLHGVATPVNAALLRVGDRLVRSGAPPGSMTVDEVRAEISSG